MKRKGYTLVELIASLAIISIIFTIGFMELKFIKKFHMKWKSDICIMK